MIHNKYYIVVYFVFILNVQILSMREPLYDLYLCLYYIPYSLEYHLNIVQSVNIYISLVICNYKHFVTFFREDVKLFLSHSNSFVDITFDTYMPIFKFLAPANSSMPIRTNKQTNKIKNLKLQKFASVILMLFLTSFP